MGGGASRRLEQNGKALPVVAVRSCSSNGSQMGRWWPVESVWIEYAGLVTALMPLVL